MGNRISERLLCINVSFNCRLVSSSLKVIKSIKETANPFSIFAIEQEKRLKGKTSYTFSKLIELAIDGITSQTDRLLRISIYTGFIFAFISFVSTVYIIIKSIESGFKPGWASTTVLIIFATGLILISLGIVGIYIGKIFNQTKGRPLYLIEKKMNMDKGK